MGDKYQSDHRKRAILYELTDVDTGDDEDKDVNDTSTRIKEIFHNYNIYLITRKHINF